MQNNWILNAFDSPKYCGTNLEGGGGRLGSLVAGSMSLRGSSIAPSIDDSGLSITLEARLVEREPLTSDIYSSISSLSLRCIAISPFSLPSCFPVHAKIDVKWAVRALVVLHQGRIFWKIWLPSFTQKIGNLLKAAKTIMSLEKKAAKATSLWTNINLVWRVSVSHSQLTFHPKVKCWYVSQEKSTYY